jgi:hypothetical protein
MGNQPFTRAVGFFSSSTINKTKAQAMAEKNRPVGRVQAIQFMNNTFSTDQNNQQHA